MMRITQRAFSLPAQFEVRFVASRVLSFLPVFSAILLFFWKLHTKWFFLFAAKYVFFLILIGYLAWRRAGMERRSIETLAEKDIEFARSHAVDKVSSHVLPLIGASLIAGVIWSFMNHDARYLIPFGVLGSLLGLGLLFRWIVYERWVCSQISAVKTSST